MRSFHKTRVLWIALLLVFTNCSRSVPSDQIPGSYKANYPFGSATLEIRTNGTFTQTVSITKEQTSEAHGSWEFDGQRSKLTLRGAMAVVDGFGHLRKDWNSVDDLLEQPVERIWSKVEIQTNEEYPYVKQ